MQSPGNPQTLNSRVTYLINQICGYYKMLEVSINDRAVDKNEVQNDLKFLNMIWADANLKKEKCGENFFTLEQKIDIMQNFIFALEDDQILKFSSTTSRVIASDHGLLRSSLSEAIQNILKELQIALEQQKRPPKKLSNFEKYCKSYSAACGGILMTMDPPDDIKGLLLTAQITADGGSELYKSYPADFTPDEAKDFINELDKKFVEIYERVVIEKSFMNLLKEDYEKAFNEIDITLDKDLLMQLNLAETNITAKTSALVFEELIQRLHEEIANTENNKKLQSGFLKISQLLEHVYSIIKRQEKISWSQVNEQFLQIIESIQLTRSKKITAGFFRSTAAIPQVLKDARFVIQYHKRFQNNITIPEKITQFLENTKKLIENLEEEKIREAVNELNIILAEVDAILKAKNLVIWELVQERICEILIRYLELDKRDLDKSNPTHNHLLEILDFVDQNKQDQAEMPRIPIRPNIKP